jgi:hypothetical protein
MPVKGNARSICISDELLFIGSYTGPVSIFSLKSPFAPRLLSTVNGHSEASDISVRNSILAIADLHQGILVYDVSDPRLPKLLAKTGCLAHEVFFDGEYVYVTEEDGLRIFELVNGER